MDIVSCLKNRRGTFLIDTLILLPWCFGPLIVFLTMRFFGRHADSKKTKRILQVLFVLTIVPFWLIGLGLYFDIIPTYAIFGLSGNDFMWNWPFSYWGINLMNELPSYAFFWSFWNMLGLFVVLMVYPLCLCLGVQIGYLFFGRSSKQRGMIDLFFKKSIPNEFK